MIEFATRKIREGVDIVVMGHRHVPALLPIEHGLYVNLGDWISYNSYGVIVDGVMSLNTWNGSIEQCGK